MGIKLEDGTGKGFEAKVDNKNLLMVKATSRSEEHVASEEGDAFAVNTTQAAPTLTTTATGGIILLSQYLGDVFLVIQRIITSCDTADGVLSFIKNPTIGTLGNHLEAPARNMNFSSGKTLNAQAWSWDETGDGITGITGGDRALTFIHPAAISHHPIEGSIILRKNDILAIEFTGIISEFVANVRCYEVDD